MRRAITGGVAGIAVINFVGVSLGVDGVADRIMVSLPGAQSSIIWPGRFTLYEDMGYVRGGPERNGDATALVRGLEAQGVRSVAFDPSTNYIDFGPYGLWPLLDEAGINLLSKPVDLADSRYLLARAVRPGDSRPCTWFRGSSGVFEQNPGTRLGIYVLEGSVAGLDARLLRDPTRPRRRYEVSCPGRTPLSVR